MKGSKKCPDPLFDAEHIDRRLEQPAYADLLIADALNAEMDRAQMCSPHEILHDIVTMNSHVKFHNLSDGEACVYTLVYPTNMTDSSTQLAVMAPVDAALLGLRISDTCRAAPPPISKCWNSNIPWVSSGVKPSS